MMADHPSQGICSHQESYHWGILGLQQLKRLQDYKAQGETFSFCVKLENKKCKWLSVHNDTECIKRIPTKTTKVNILNRKKEETVVLLINTLCELNKRTAKLLYRRYHHNTMAPEEDSYSWLVLNFQVGKLRHQQTVWKAITLILKHFKPQKAGSKKLQTDAKATYEKSKTQNTATFKN